MFNKENIVHTGECKCFAWHPIFAGALVILGLTFLLNLFSVAIGLTAYTTSHEGVESLAMGGLVGTATGIIVSMFAAGWLTGYLGQRCCSKRHLGALSGFLAWSVALIITIFLATHAQQYIAFYTHYLSGTPFIPTNNTTMGYAVTEAAHNMSAKNVAISTYIVFALFFLSAFACSLGGHCGMRHECRHDGIN